MTLAIVAVAAMASTALGFQATDSPIRGQVTDSSGGVLPGVTVVATADGRPPVYVVTDSSGGYELNAPMPGLVTLTFQLEGFAGQVVPVTVHPGAASRVVVRLELAHLSETVEVKAPVPADPVARARPLPLVRPVPAHDRDSICGPAKPDASPAPLGTIKAGNGETPGGLYAAGAELIIDGGLADGLEVGRNVVARRYYHAWDAAKADTVGEHSAGLLQIVSARDHSSVAVVVYACDELRQGDFLAAFNPEPLQSSEAPAATAHDASARILFADEGQTLGAPRRMMVIDRGAAQGTRAGQRLTLFRQRRGSASTEFIGDAVVVAVRIQSATIRVDHAVDAISAGDWAAPQTAVVAARQRH